MEERDSFEVANRHVPSRRLIQHPGSEALHCGKLLVVDDLTPGLQCSPPPHVHESSCSSKFLPYQFKKFHGDIETRKSFYPPSHPPRCKFSRSSTFCTSQFSSSSSISEAHSRINNLPFFPQPHKVEKPASSLHTSGSPCSAGSAPLLHGDMGENESDYLDVPVTNFSVLSQNASEGNSCESYANCSVPLSEQLELQILSEELGIAITGDEESPRLDVSLR